MDRLQDRISRGLGTAARALGQTTDAYRPSGASNPVLPVNRYLRLRAAFVPVDGKFGRPNAYGAALWQGIFDSAYTHPGDYLAQERGTWFVAAQQRLLPPLCVLTNRTISIVRPAAPATNGVNSYGGVTLATSTPVLTGWPANILGVAGSGRPEAGLPSDTAVPFWTVLLPAVAGVLLKVADLMTDDLGRTATVAAAELTDLGWRVTVKQATT